MFSSGKPVCRQVEMLDVLEVQHTEAVQKDQRVVILSEVEESIRLKMKYFDKLNMTSTL